MQPLNIAILGAGGYTGAELIRLLLLHPHARITALTGDSQAGKSIAEVYPHLAHYSLPPLVKHEEVDFSKIDVVFCCLPHGTTQSIIAALPKHLTIFDLSADFRLSNVEDYAKWYTHPHQAIGLQKEAVYGLSEHAREALKKARLIACPGCYPTSAQLPLIPLLKEKMIFPGGIIIDSKSGISGAGRAAKQAMLFCEINESLSAYGIGNHRHTPEIEQGLSQATGQEVRVTFTPHLIPMNRGILSTIYVTLASGKNISSLRACLSKAYSNESFVHILPEGIFPNTQQVRGTNHCNLNVFESRIPGQAIIVSVIDNLVKGASGQAVQNFNIRFDFPEITGLEQGAFVP